MSKVYLIRHGQASFLADDYDNLSEIGILQSKALGDFFAKNKIHLDKIYIGKLKRHQQTFDNFSLAFDNKNIKLPQPIYLKELNEHQALESFKLDIEKFLKQNKPAQRLYLAMQKDKALKKKNTILIFGMFMKEFVVGKYPINGSGTQSWSDFRTQTKQGIATILKNTNKGETIGVFTSGGTKSSIIGDSLGMNENKISELNMVIRNTSFSQLIYSKNSVKLFSINEIPHLTKKLTTFV
ncbi:MAG: histidine phosphatase family protein [Flavobacteriaceae bacterium]|nr:histidine phosphatase family protein [Flavobacteriaceae bacterium]